MIVELDEKNFDKKTKTGLKLIEFYASWCGYCKKQRPVIEELSANNIWIGTVNVDSNPDLAERFNITGFPAFLLFKEGKIIAALSGYHEKSQLLTNLMEHLS